MLAVYKGFCPYIVEAYLRGEKIQYQKNTNDWWEDVLPYEEPCDIHRVSNPKYYFRVNNVIKELISVYNLKDMIGDKVGNNINDFHNYIELTFTKNELTDVRIVK